MGRVLFPAHGPLDRGLEQSRKRSVCHGFAEAVERVDVVVAVVVAAAAVVVSELAVCCGNHPRATPAAEHGRSLLDVAGRELSVDAGDGDDDCEDGEDEDGRGGGRRKRTRNVMGNIRNYDIDQTDAQAQNPT